MKRFILSRLVKVLYTSGLMVVSAQAMASAFQIWEQDGASLGNVHSGYAAEAADASTAWYNPAGITRFDHQQLVFGEVVIVPSFKYKGDVTVITPFDTTTFSSVSAQGGTFNLVPSLHYVAPITDRLGFGFSLNVPFGLKTDYGRTSPLRYAGTLTSVQVIDLSPSLAYRIFDKASIGAGFDIQRMYGEFDQTGTPFATEPVFDTENITKVNDNGYGYHLGALYEFNPSSRLGISYHSQVVHHLSGSSKFIGPLANDLNGGPFGSSRATVNVTLPAYTALSFYQRVHPQVALMATAIYTQWNGFRTLSLHDAAGILNMAPSTSINVTVPEYYHNSWGFSAGANYYATETITLRGGFGYDQTPVRREYRTAQLPDCDRYLVGIGSHFQATKALGFDIAYSHVFSNRSLVNPPPEVTGDQTVQVNGHVNGSADVIGAQLVWDFA
jgi:long-chain fatty acid transport protein